MTLSIYNPRYYKVHRKQLRRHKYSIIISTIPKVIGYLALLTLYITIIYQLTQPTTLVYYSVSQDQCVKVMRDNQEYSCSTINNDECYETIYVQ